MNTLEACSVHKDNAKKPFSTAGAKCGHKTSHYDNEYAYQYKISGADLHSSKHSQNDGHDMEEIGKDGSPLISQKVKHLPL